MSNNQTYANAFDRHANNACHNDLAMMPQQYLNSTLLITIMQSLMAKYHFQSFVFFLSRELQRYATCTMPHAVHMLHDILSVFPMTPHIIIRQNGSYQMATQLNADTLCLVLTTGTEDDIMELTAASLTTVRWLKSIFVLLPSGRNFPLETAQLNATVACIFKWLWRKQFLHTLLLAGNVFVPQPYPNQTVFSLAADAWHVNDFFQLHSRNMQGYVLNMPIVNDMPRVFTTQRIRNNVPHQLSGVPALLMLTFFNHVNVTFNDTSADLVGPRTFETLIRLTNDNVFETIMNAYTWMQNDDLSMSYPLAINDWCFMVPFRNRTPAELYLHSIFESHTWLLYWSFSVLLSFIIWLLTPRAQRNLQIAWLQSVCASLYITPLRVVRIATPSMRILAAFLFVYGFCICNLYGTKLSSILTSPPHQHQIDNEADVIAADLKLMLTAFEMVHLRPRVSARFAQQLLVVPIGVLDEHRIQLNTSYGYSVPSDRWSFISKQQRFRAQPLFRLSHICMGPYYQVYPLQHDTHLRTPLQHFILKIQQYGFLQHWDEMAFLDAWVDGLVTIHVSHIEITPLTMDFFRLVWVNWCIGMIVAGIAFVYELNDALLRRCLRQVLSKFQSLRRSW